jgi:hypothetical protein
MKYIGAILTAAFLLIAVKAYAEECSYDCNGTGFTLYLNDDQLSWPEGELTEEQCNEMKAEIEPQAPPFTALECRESAIKREEI